VCVCVCLCLCVCVCLYLWLRRTWYDIYNMTENLRTFYFCLLKKCTNTIETKSALKEIYWTYYLYNTENCVMLAADLSSTFWICGRFWTYNTVYHLSIFHFLFNGVLREIIFITSVLRLYGLFANKATLVRCLPNYNRITDPL